MFIDKTKKARNATKVKVAKLLILGMLLCASFSIAAQTSVVEFQSISTTAKSNPNFKIIKFDLNNLISCIDMPISEFETLLVSNGFGLWTPNHDEYSNGNTTWGYQTVNKEPGLLTIFFSDNWQVETKSIFNRVLDQLDKYYIDRDNDVVIYEFKKGDKNYTIKVVKENLLLRIYSK